MGLSNCKTVILMLVVLGVFPSLGNVVCADGVRVGASGSPGPRWVVKVTADPNVVPLDGQTVAALLRSDSVLRRVTRGVREEHTGYGAASFRCETLTAEPQVSPLGRTAVVVLDVNLPAADEFVAELVSGLRLVLEQTYQAHKKDLGDQLRRARSEQDAARAAYRMAIEQAAKAEEPIRLDPDDQAIYDQLDKQVDLSMLSPDMPFEDAIEALKDAVDPPLPVVVLWRDLLDNGDVDADAPIMINPPAPVRLGTGLQKVLEGVSGGFAELDYTVDAGVVTVATVDGLRVTGMETRIHDVPAVLRAMGQEQLARTIQETVEPESWFEQSERGKGTIVPSDDGQLVVWQNRPIHKKIQALLREMAKGASVTLPVEAPPATLKEQLRLSLAYRDKVQEPLDKLQMRLAEIERRRLELDERLIENSWQDISGELWVIVSELQRIQEDPTGAPGAESLAGVIRKVKECLDKHKDGTPAWRPVGFDGGSSFGGSLEQQTVSRRIIAEQKALRDVHVRIGEIQRALLGQENVDPHTHGIRQSARRLHRAAVRVDDLQQRLAILPAPSVTVLDAGD